MFVEGDTLVRPLNLEAAISLLIILVAVLSGGSIAWAYPGGPLQDVTDAAPFCAACHSSTDANQLRDLQGPRKEHMLAASHVAAIKDGSGNYSKLTPEQRNQLAADVQKVDDNAKVSLVAPAAVSRGADFAVRVDTRGGSGPVVGVMLLDEDLRNQARAIEAENFAIVGAPKVIGPDGNRQEQWEARRYDDLRRNLNFLVVFGIKADLATNQFSSAEVVYNLSAPTKRGKYTICAAFLYGTEKASPLGRVEMNGRILPLGGFDGASGRIKFSELQTIEVR